MYRCLTSKCFSNFWTFTMELNQSLFHFLFSSQHVAHSLFSLLSHFLSYRGLISLNSSDTFYLEPINSVSSSHHSLLSAEELPIKGGNCGHGHHATQVNHFSNLVRPFHSRVSLFQTESEPVSWCL